MFRFSVVDTKGKGLGGVRIVITDIYSKNRTTFGDTDSNGKLTLHFDILIPEVKAEAEAPAGYTCVRCVKAVMEHEGSTQFVMASASVPPPPHPTTCKDLGFTEIVRCERVGDYFYAAGWTASKGIGAAAYPYSIPFYWEADPSNGNVYGPLGSHGVCPNCAATLVHIRRHVGDVPPPEGHCYNAAGELVMEHGEEKCVSGDKYVCSNGILSVSERDPDCNGNGKACPIACVCMGTPLIDALGPIREFRDFVLKRGKLGRCFVSFYYSQVGPFLSLALVRSKTLRKGGRWVVRRILRRLEK